MLENSGNKISYPVARVPSVTCDLPSIQGTHSVSSDLMPLLKSTSQKWIVTITTALQCFRYIYVNSLPFKIAIVSPTVT